MMDTKKSLGKKLSSKLSGEGKKPKFELFFTKASTAFVSPPSSTTTFMPSSARFSQDLLDVEQPSTKKLTNLSAGIVAPAPTRDEDFGVAGAGGDATTAGGADEFDSTTAVSLLTFLQEDDDSTAEPSKSYSASGSSKPTATPLRFRMTVNPKIQPLQIVNDTAGSSAAAWRYAATNLLANLEAGSSSSTVTANPEENFENDVEPSVSMSDSKNEAGAGDESSLSNVRPSPFDKNAAGDTVNGICKHFLRGKCRFREKCRHSHDIDNCVHCNAKLPKSRLAASAHLSKCYKNKYGIPAGDNRD